MSKPKYENLRKYTFEFLAIFIGIFAAFALDNWNENRKEHRTELNILTEINHGLEQDMKDMALNEMGHKWGINAVKYFRNVITGSPASPDSFSFHYFNLFRNFVSIQNVGGYETLKSKGLEIVENDSLRYRIISLYENGYSTLEKMEEDYGEMQFHERYFDSFTKNLAPNISFSQSGKTIITSPLKLSDSEKKIMIIQLWKLQQNREFMLAIYKDVKSQVTKVQAEIKKELGR